MDWRSSWQKKLEEAERELAVAGGRTARNAAARKLQEARRALTRLDTAEKPARGRSTGGRDSEGDAS